MKTLCLVCDKELEKSSSTYCSRKCAVIEESLIFLRNCRSVDFLGDSNKRIKKRLDSISEMVDIKEPDFKPSAAFQKYMDSI